MKLKTKNDIQEMMGAHLSSAAINVAIERGLFWRFSHGPKSYQVIAQEMQIPLQRCRYWLQLLASMDLLVRNGDHFNLSLLAQQNIVETYSRESWQMLAIDAKDNFEDSLCLVQELGGNSRIQFRPSSYPNHIAPYVQKMAADPERARKFTQMLFELHTPLAQNVAEVLDLEGVASVLDVGGGSGVVSLTLLQKYPQLYAVVVDIPNVCEAGREIASQTIVHDRIAYYPADFVQDELPKGFDLVLLCDLGQINELSMAKVAASLNEGGRLVIVDTWFDTGAEETTNRFGYLLHKSLRDPEFTLRTLQDVLVELEEAGLEPEPIVELPYKQWKLIVARKKFI